MARLETQINQIYLTYPESKKNSLILYEETLNASSRLFIVSELRGLEKKSEASDLKKISEIILISFRNQKKLSAETLFELALAQINQNLADLAHEGHKSWVGKFSCLLVLKSSENIYLANNGQTGAWLNRKGELMEVLPPEKRGTHPLKTFQNFTQGKVIDGDGLILATANIFNYVSFELFGKIINQKPLDQASVEISKILQDSLSSGLAFCCFLLGFNKKPLVAAEENLPAPQAIYAPVAEEIVLEDTPAVRSFKFSLPSWGKLSFRLPKFKINSRFFGQLSGAGKFFFINFTIFLTLFIITLVVFNIRLRERHKAEDLQAKIASINKNFDDIQAALIIKDESKAFLTLSEAHKNWENLNNQNHQKAGELSDRLAQVDDLVNKISVVESPKVYAEFKHHPIFLAKSPSGFLLSGLDSNSVSLFDSKTTKDYFLLNSLKQNITGVSFWQPAGVILSIPDEIYDINENLKQYESLLKFSDSSIDRIKTFTNFLYALDTKKGQLTRISSSKNKYATQTITKGDFSNIRDFAIDKDAYLLSPDSVIKVVSGLAQKFPYPQMTDKITNATRIFVGSNIYVLEPNKKRIVVLNKTGGLVSQIIFPAGDTLLDFYVDEAGRNLYLLDDSRLYRITI